MANFKQLDEAPKITVTIGDKTYECESIVANLKVIGGENTNANLIAGATSIEALLSSLGFITRDLIDVLARITDDEKEAVQSVSAAFMSGLQLGMDKLAGAKENESK